jgi:hypothetical protein
MRDRECAATVVDQDISPHRDSPIGDGYNANQRNIRPRDPYTLLGVAFRLIG